MVDNCHFDSENDKITVVVREDNGQLEYETPKMTFMITPDIPPGSKSTDYITINFEVEYDLGKYYQESLGVQNIKWSSGDQIWKESGSKQFRIKNHLELQLELFLNVNQVLKSGSTYHKITFSDESGQWAHTYDLLLKGIKT